MSKFICTYSLISKTWSLVICSHLLISHDLILKLLVRPPVSLGMRQLWPATEGAAVEPL